jgi:protein SCO1
VKTLRKRGMSRKASLAIGLIFMFCLGSSQVILAHNEHAGTTETGAEPVNAMTADEDQASGKDWVDEKTGDYLPLETEFTDSSGKIMPLRAIIDRPTLILPIYFSCPNSCSLNLSYLATAIRTSSLKPGADFKVIAFSFNANERAEDARNAKENYLKQLSDNFPADDWKFLVGNKESIKALTEALGYKFKRMPDGTFVHPSALIAVSDQGRIIKYVYGSFLSGDVDMALLDAKQGTPALSVKRLLGFCFNNDSKSSNSVLQKVKIGLLIGSLVLGGLFVVFLRRSGKRKVGQGGESE